MVLGGQFRDSPGLGEEVSGREHEESAGSRAGRRYSSVRHVRQHGGLPLCHSLPDPSVANREVGQAALSASR